MSRQPASAPKQAQGNEEVAQATGEQETQSQATGANNLDTRLPGNDGDDGDSASNHEDDGASNSLYELLLDAEHDDDAMTKLESNWDKLKNMINTPYPSDDNKTSLHLAAAKGFEKVVKKLLDEGANISVGDEDGWTPLHFACSREHTKVVEMLLDSGADPTATSKHGPSPLDRACMLNQLGIAKALVQKCPNLLKQRSTDMGWTPLHWATLHNNKDMVTLFLENGACIDAKDDDGWTPLMAAVKWEHEETMDTLIKYIQGLEEPNTSHHLDVCDEEQKTPLMAACENGFEQGVRALCEAGASCNAQDCAGRTALHYAVKSSQLGIVETLVEKTDPKLLLVADHNGASAFDDLELHFDKEDPTDTVTSVLVNRLTQENMQTEALGWAAQNTKRHKIFQMLVTGLVSENVVDKASAEVSSAFEWAVVSRRPQVLEFLADNFSATEDLELVRAAEKLAKDLRQNKGKKAEGEKYTQKDPAAELAKNKPNHDSLILHDMENYLNDFCLAETHRRSLFKPPKSRENVDTVLPNFHATITQFFTRRTRGQQGRTKWVKHSRSVKDVIYGQGPAWIAREAMKRWFDHPRAEPRPSPVQKDDPEIITQLKWIHLPVTNIVWMEDLVRKILKERKFPLEEIRSLASFFRSSWVQVPDGTSASRFMRPLYIAKPVGNHDTEGEDAPDLTSSTKKDALSSSSGPDKATHSRETIEGSRKPRQSRVSAAYFPYLSFSKNVVYKDLDEPYKALLDVYKEDALHQSATLDEAYYHFASDSESKKEQDARNKTQVVTKYLRKKEEGSPGALTLIRVKQLWIWTILDEWIITATPHPVDGTQEDDLPKDFLNHPSTQEMVGEAPPQSTFAAHMATLIANYCVDAYERKRINRQGGTKQHSDSSSSSIQSVKKERSTRSIRQIFSDSVNDIARKEKKLFEDFDKLCLRKRSKTTPSDDRTRYMETENEDQPEKDAADEVKSLTTDDAGKTDGAKPPTTGDADNLETILINASELACTVKDIRDEVNILRSIVNFQLTVQNGMGGNPQSNASITAHYFLKDIEELETVAQRVQDSVNTTLNLVETEMANEQSREATRQGRTMMVFTVVTTLFLPLSFLSSLFALDVSSFQQAPNWALIVIFLASLAFFIPAASIALFSDAVFRQCRKCWDLGQAVLSRDNYVKSRKTKTNMSAV